MDTPLGSVLGHLAGTPKTDIAELVALSEKATQGPWAPENAHQLAPKSTICYLYFGKPLGPKPHIDGYSDCLSVCSERGLQDAQFIAALVNWFRANATALSSREAWIEELSRRQKDSITEALIHGLNQLENQDKFNAAKSAAEVRELAEGGVAKYLNDAIFHAKVQMLRSRVMLAIDAALSGKGELK